MRGRWGIVLALALVGAACSSGGGQEPTHVTIAGHTIVNHGEIDIGGQTAEDVQADNYFFDPTVLSGSGGQSITLSIDNQSSGTLHNFSVTQQQIDQDVPPGQNVKVTVQLPASGTLVFFCKYHQSQGMVGALRAG